MSAPSTGLLGRSVRLRLSVWYTAVLALVLVAFSSGTYGYLVHATRQRVDRSLAETARAFDEVWGLEVADSVGSPAIAARDAARDLRGTDRRVLVYDETGRRIAASEDSPLAPLLTSAALATADGSPVAELVRMARAGRPGWATLPGPEGGVRAHAAVVSRVGVSYTVVVFASLAGETETNDDLLRGLLLAIPLALTLAGAGGYLIVRASLARLEQAFALQRQFMADASHELRTPVAALQSVADVTLGRDDRSSPEYREALVAVSAEGRRLARIVEDLFLLARADAGQQPVRLQDVALEEVVAECARSARALAAARGVRIEAPPGPESPVRGDPQLLHRLVMNLLNNAIEQTPSGGAVSLALTSENGAYRVLVRDAGPGVPEELRPRLFERFVRGDPTRGRGAAGEGAGLGLAIAKWIAEAHGGVVALEASGSDGSTFSVTLPAPGGA